MTCGIYLITNRINNKRYVGRSVNIERRWSNHSRGRKGTRVFHQAINKYGVDNFTLEILQECPETELIELEKFYIEQLQPEYNLLVTQGDGVLHHLPETRSQMSLARRGEANANYGHKLSEEAKARISLSNSGRSPSEETRQKLSQASRGTVRTDETKAKMSKWQIGRKLPESTKQKISLTRQGMVQSEEVQKKRSESLKAYWRNKRLAILTEES